MLKAQGYIIIIIAIIHTSSNIYTNLMSILFFPSAPPWGNDECFGIYLLLIGSYSKMIYK